MGIIIHFGPNTFAGKEFGRADPKIFNPQHVDREQWVQTAKAVGAKYVIVVAKHHDGFCLFPSQGTAYGVGSSSRKDGKVDLVSDLSEACREAWLKFDTNLSPYIAHDHPTNTERRTIFITRHKSKSWLPATVTRWCLQRGPCL